MAGPVLALELLQGSRRGRQQLLRWVYGGWLLLQLAFFVLLLLVRAAEEELILPGGRSGNPSRLGTLTASFLILLVAQQALLLVLALPAFAAGAITEEKTRGTLQQLLTTALTPGEIVVGKLLGQLARVLDLSLPGWILIAFVAGLAGLLPSQLLGLAGSLLAPLPALGAAALLASVWCRRTSSAVLAAYAVTALALAAPWAVGGLRSPVGPLAAVWAAADQGATPPLRQLVVAWLGWVCLAVPPLLLATWRLRPAYVRQLTAVARRSPGPGVGHHRPPVGDHPVRWKEQYVERVLDVPGLRRVPRRLGFAAVFLLGLIASLGIVLAHLPPGSGPGSLRRQLLYLQGVGSWRVLSASAPSWKAFALQGLVVTFLASLAAGARAAGTVSGERERQTWEALLLTPLTTKQLVRSKVWGTVNVFRPYLVAWTIPTVALSLCGGVLAVICTCTCWGLAWVMMYFMASCGIASSVRSASSWRSWLGTLLAGYRTVFGYLALGGAPCGLVGGVVVRAVLLALGGQSLAWHFFVTLDVFPATIAWLAAAVTAVLLFARSEQLLTEAEKHLDQTDRIPQRLRVRPPVAGVAVVARP